MLRTGLQEAIRDKDLECISVKEIRTQLAQMFGFAPDGLECRKREIKKLTADVVQGIQPHDVVSFLQLLLGQKGEKEDARQHVYLVTVSRVLEATLEDGRRYEDLNDMERNKIADAVSDSFNNPMSSALGGRPRNSNTKPLISFLVVFREFHEDGSVHFHIVVKLVQAYRFAAAKRTLRERHLLPSHWSCTHTMLWSALRYVYIGTPTKPEVDETPWVWTANWEGYETDDGVPLDLFELSQEPFRADSWRKRYQAVEREASKKAAKTAFTKLDLTAIIMSKHLWSRDSLMAYTQERGTSKMQQFVHQRQRKLALDIEDAKEWAAAKDNAAFESISDWALVCQSAQTECPHGCATCSYHLAAEDIFRQNEDTLDRNALAGAIRDILMNGPKKTNRVPFLVGPSNTGKSTLVYPLDDLFTPKRVLHKPAIGSSFGLRNLVDGTKRLIFWDDFRPVEFAHEKTVPVSLFLSLFVGQHFEVQVSQSFNDGNKDVQWQRGVIFTGKQEGLWDETRLIGTEDVRHMRNRVREFVFHRKLADDRLKDVVSCAPCMARWILSGANAYDAAGGLQPVLPVQGPGNGHASLDATRVAAIRGFQELLEALQVPASASEELLADLERLGAVSVHEPTAADWESMNAWALLRPLQQRRLLQHTGAQ